MKWILSCALMLAVAGCPAANNEGESANTPVDNSSKVETPKPEDKKDVVVAVDTYELRIDDMT
ncbi:MAG: hypothetical protein ACYTDT_00460 [Planctomycetota bacterium]|jgi:hypothetical protein